MQDAQESPVGDISLTLEIDTPKKSRFGFTSLFSKKELLQDNVPNTPPLEQQDRSSSYFSALWGSKKDLDVKSSAIATQQSPLKTSSYTITNLLSYRSSTSSKKEEEQEEQEQVDEELANAGRFSGLYKRIPFRKSAKGLEVDMVVEEPPDSTVTCEDLAILAPPGAFVSTAYGTGVLRDIRECDGFYIVKLVSNSIAYLHPSAIYHEVKATVGERVSTQWGLGTVESYFPQSELYLIALDWRWDDDHVWKIKATTDKFERCYDSILTRTSSYLTEGYSNLVGSTSNKYASVKAKFDRFARPEPMLTQIFTVFGEATLLQVRKDGIHVAKTMQGEIIFLQSDQVVIQQKTSAITAADRLDTPFGKGIVLRQRPTDGMYEIQLPWKLSNGQHAMMYMPPERAEDYGSSSDGRISSILKFTKRSIKSRGSSMKASASGGLSSVKNKFASLAGSPTTQFTLGERVLTAFGSGFIKGIRYDNAYVVKLRRLNVTAYLQERDLSPFPYHKVSHYVVEGKKPAKNMTIDAKKKAPRQLMRQVTSMQALRYRSSNKK